MSDRIKIINLTNMSLVIPELSLNLPGKGSSSFADLIASSTSATLTMFLSKRWVKIESQITDDSMRCWPFYTPPAPLTEFNTSVPENTKSSSMEEIMISIQSLIQKLVDKQPSPEILATHIAIQNQKLSGVVPGATHVSGRLDDAPEFIPRNIVPTSIDMSIKSDTQTSEKMNLDDAAQALKKLKKK